MSCFSSSFGPSRVNRSSLLDINLAIYLHKSDLFFNVPSVKRYIANNSLISDPLINLLTIMLYSELIQRSVSLREDQNELLNRGLELNRKDKIVIE